MASNKADKVEKVVTAPVVSVEGPNGVRFYAYRGTSADGFSASEVKRLEELGMVGNADDNQDAVPGVGVHPDAR